MLESAAYQLSNIHWISPTAKIVHFKYPDGQDDEDLPPQALPIEPLNQFKAPFRLALSCQAFGYPELQVRLFLNFLKILNGSMKRPTYGFPNGFSLHSSIGS